MNENMKEVLARVMANRQNSPQVSTPEPKPMGRPPKSPAPVKEEAEEDYIDEEEPEVLEEKPVKKAESVAKIEPNQEQIEAIVRDMELLHNTGRYRVELLHQMQEINQSLMIIAEVLTNLTANGKRTG